MGQESRLLDAYIPYCLNGIRSQNACYGLVGLGVVRPLHQCLHDLDQSGTDVRMLWSCFLELGLSAE